MSLLRNSIRNILREAAEDDREKIAKSRAYELNNLIELFKSKFEELFKHEIFLQRFDYFIEKPVIYFYSTFQNSFTTSGLFGIIYFNLLEKDLTNTPFFPRSEPPIKNKSKLPKRFTIHKLLECSNIEEFFEMINYDIQIFENLLKLGLIPGIRLEQYKEKFLQMNQNKEEERIETEIKKLRLKSNAARAKLDFEESARLEAEIKRLEQSMLRK